MGAKLLAGLFVLIGSLIAAGAVFEWDWFMNRRRVRGVYTVMGRTGARIFYIVLGLAVAAACTLMLLGVIGPSA